MNAWFTPDQAPFFAFVSLLSLLSLLERYAERGQYQVAVLSACTAALLAGIALLAAATLAHERSQPPHVFLTLNLSGGLVTLGSAIGLLRVVRLYYVARRLRAPEPSL